jgi:hypothetical protein
MFSLSTLALTGEPPRASVKSYYPEELTVAKDSLPKRAAMMLVNVASKTGGGTQLWTDFRNRNGFRLQQNCVSGHWRLLDASDVRRTWGTRAHCEAQLNQLQPPIAATSQPRHVVVLLHGLMRTHHSMKGLEKDLVAAGFPHVIRFAYASSRRSIGDHAAALREVLEDLPAGTELSFVGHSMGNIVVRYLIGELQRQGDPAGLLPRCRSMVMLGPPNQGAAIARRLASSGLYGLVLGKGGVELGPQWQDFVQRLATPPFPFAIIAGDLSEKPVQNPLIEGSSDFVVLVDEARLEGSESFQTVPVIHSLLMTDQATKQKVVEFIKSH